MEALIDGFIKIIREIGPEKATLVLSLPSFAIVAYALHVLLVAIKSLSKEEK